LKQHFTLEEGDIVMTGTPKGVGEIKASSVFEGSVSADNVTLVNNQWQAK
ncbi:MAG: fumarylacetoacetate hydrolase family protein, partial [Psychrobium sp.]